MYNIFIEPAGQKSRARAVLWPFKVFGLVRLVSVYVRTSGDFCYSPITLNIKFVLSERFSAICSHLLAADRYFSSNDKKFITLTREAGEK